MVRIVLIDDEELARRGMRTMLAEHKNVEIVGEAENGREAVALIEKLRPDGVFLDIRMPMLDGFQTLKQLASPPAVIFVTAYSEHAVRAFEVQAVDYLLKPVRPQRLAQALQRLCQALGKDSLGVSSVYEPADKLCLRTPERTILVDQRDLCALEAEGDFTKVYLPDERPFLLGQGLGELADTLPTPPFYRVSRSLMVNLKRVKALDGKGRDRGHLTLDGIAQSFLLGRVARARLLELLKDSAP